MEWPLKGLNRSTNCEIRWFSNLSAYTIKLRQHIYIYLCCCSFCHPVIFMFACLLSLWCIISKLDFFIQQTNKKDSTHRQCCWKSRNSTQTLVWESQQGRLLCSRSPTALAVWLLQVEWGATKVVSHCCIDRCSNYILLHSVPISIQHQQTPLKLHYALAKWNKSPNIQWFWHSKRDTDPFWG